MDRGPGGAGAAPILAATHTWATAGEELLHTSERMGETVEKISELKYAAAETGVAGESLVGGMRHMQAAISRLGTPEAQAKIIALGLSLEDLRAQSPIDQLGSLADTIAAISDPADRAGAAAAVFGKHLGAELLPLLMRGRAGIEALTAEAREWGFVATHESAEGATQLASSFRRLEMVTGGIWKALGAALGPATRQYTDILARNLKTVKDWVAANGELVRTVFKWASIVALGGTAIYAFGKMFVLAGSALGIFRDMVLWTASTLQSLLRVGSLILSPFRAAASAVLGLAWSIITVWIPAVAVRIGLMALATAAGAVRVASVVGAFAIAGFGLALRGLGIAARAVPAALSIVYRAMQAVAPIVDVAGRGLAAGFIALPGLMRSAWSGLLNLPQRIGQGFFLAGRAAQAAWSAAAYVAEVAWLAVQAVGILLSEAYAAAAAFVGAVWSAIPARSRWPGPSCWRFPSCSPRPMPPRPRLSPPPGRCFPASSLPPGPHSLRPCRRFLPPR